MTGLQAQIPNTWTEEKLKQAWLVLLDKPTGDAVKVDYAMANIKNITFQKLDREGQFNEGECFSLIIMVLRGPGAPAVKAEDPNIQVTKKGGENNWTDRISGYSVTEAGSRFGFNDPDVRILFSVRRNGKLQVTANYYKLLFNRKSGPISEFVLTNVGD